MALAAAVLIAVGVIAIVWSKGQPNEEPETKTEEIIVEVVPENTQEEASTSVFTMRSRTVTMNRVDLSFELPTDWRMEMAEGTREGAVDLLSSSGKRMATIQCPIPATGGPYEHTNVELLERSFSRGGVEYTATFRQLAANVFEEYLDDNGEKSSRYVGPGTKIDYIFSIVRPVDVPDKQQGCMLYRYDSEESEGDNLTEQEVNALRSINSSWK